MKRAWLALPCILAAAFAAQAAEYTRLLPEHSRIAFVSRQMGVPVEGEFRRYSAELRFDPARPEAARAVIEIDLASVDAGPREVNEELLGRNWFHVRQHPAARFESASVRSLGGGRYEVRGPLTLKGRTREAVAAFSFRPQGRHGVFEGGFALKRLDFGIGEGPWGDTGTVADEVQVRFRFVAEPAGKP